MEIFRHPKLDMPAPGLFAEEQEPAGVFIGLKPGDELSLLELPQGATPRAVPSLTALEQADVAVREILAGIRYTLAHHRASSPPAIFSLRGLTEEERALVDEILARGEVEARIGGDPAYVLQETALAGLWRGAAYDGGGRAVAHWLEIADVPGVVREAVASFATRPVSVAAAPGTMNLMPLLAEIDARSRAWRAGEANHVISFTLFPLTPEDSSGLRARLEQAPIEILSKGYGTCRAIATRCPHVWGVQFLNVMGTVILDTLEVGDVPAAVRAADEDFQDSAARLHEIMEACWS